MTELLRPTRTAIPLSVPHLEGGELAAIERALSSNWIAPIGPEVDAFEEELAQKVGATRALATTSGTAAIHLALRVLGVGPGDEVLVSTLTFCASANPVLYQGARLTFIDAEQGSWNLDPALLEEEMERRGKDGSLPAAVVVVHLFGQPARMSRILEICRRWDVPVVEDAAAALGGTHREPPDAEQFLGTMGDLGIYSFDGSKVITTSMGGMLVTGHRPELVEHARKLARQAREPVPHYEHLEIGYNYRLSNLLAAIGRVQLEVLDLRVEQRRAVFQAYRSKLSGIEGIEFQPEALHGMSSRWLTAILLDPTVHGVSPEELRQHLLTHGIESRPLWKPLHLQPVYRDLGLRCVEGSVSEDLFDRGLCLPSSSSLDPVEIENVCSAVRDRLAHV